MNPNQNPLDIDLSSVDVSRPLLSGPVELPLKIEKATIEVGKTNPQARMLSLELSTTAPAQALDGTMLGAGVRVFHRENFVRVGKLTDDQIVKGIGSIVQCFKLQGVKLGQIDQWHKQLEGRIGPVRVVVVPEQTRDGRTFQAKNEVSAFVVKKV